MSLFLGGDVFPGQAVCLDVNSNGPVSHWEDNERGQLKKWASVVLVLVLD